MPDPNRNNEPDKNEKRNGELRLPPRTFLIWIGIIGLISVLALVKNGSETPVEELPSFGVLLNKLTNNLIVPDSGRMVNGLQVPELRRLTGRYYKTDPDGKKSVTSDGKPVEIPFKFETELTDKKKDLIIDSGQFKSTNNSNLMVNLFLNTFLPFFLILGAVYFFIFRQIKMAGKGAMSLAKAALAC